MTKTTPAYRAAIDMLAGRRKALHLRQADVDRLAGWADGYTGKVECGMRRLSLRGMVVYAKALGCHLVIEDAGGSRQLNAGTTDIFLVTALAEAKCTLKTAENSVRMAKRTGQIDNSLESLRKAANELANAVSQITAISPNTCDGHPRD